jgi:hypothetical protein
MLDRKEKILELTEAGVKKVLFEYQEKGYGYSDYPWVDDSSSSTRGVSLTSRSRMVEMARSVGPWEPVYYLESGWHALQDVYAFMLRGQARNTDDLRVRRP